MSDNKWIKTSERLPETDNCDYLVTLAMPGFKPYVTICGYDKLDKEEPFCNMCEKPGKRHGRNGLKKKYTIAWMPMPEPYEEDKNES